MNTALRSHARAATHVESCRPDCRAFTLIEIMIVVGILAIVMAMGIPSFVQLVRKDPLRQGVSDVVEALSAARALAILEGRTAEMIVHATDPIRVTVQPVAGPNPAPAEEPGDAYFAKDRPVGQDSTRSATLAFELHRDIALTMLDVNFKDQMDQEVSRVRFHPNGISDEFTIVLEWEGGMRKISLDSVTGQADVENLR